MWLQAEINQNLDRLINIVSDEDVLRIARTINKENDEHICSRIAFELSLNGNSGSLSHAKQPILVQALDVLDETFLKNKKESPEKTRLERLHKKLGEIHSLIEDQKTYDVISNTEEKLSENLDAFKSLLPSIYSSLDTLLHDSHAYRKKQNKEWGTLGRYRIFLRDCALLYSELTGEDFTVDFHRDKANKTCSPLTKGTLFLYEFHNLLNKISTAYSCENLTDSNFATACSEVRTQLNKEKILLNKNTEKK